MHSADENIHSVPAKSHRFHLLDALRGIAAFLVLAWHIPSYLRPLLSYPNGFLAVDFFFCLSGFVIGFSYEERLKTRMTMAGFAVARLIRLYPLYLLGAIFGLASSLVVAHAASDPSVSKADVFLVVLFAIFLIPNFVAHWPLALLFPVNGPSWSLFYEIAANLAFAGLVKRRFANTAVLLTLAAISLAVLAKASGKGWGIQFGVIPATFGLGIARVGYSFLMGILVCRLYFAQRQPAFAGVLNWVMSLSVMSAMVAVLLASSNFARSPHFQILAVAILFPSIVYLGACCSLSNRWSGVCGFFGDFSYPLYILHDPLILALSGRKMKNFAVHHASIAQVLVAILCPILVALAWCAGKFYDAPIRKWLTATYNAHAKAGIAAISKGRL
jgi:peptidoglycan/LPS O-acetylase OafA/YrhL